MNKEEFIKNIKELNLEINDEILSKLDKYYKLLNEWNNKFNLTTILEEESVYLKHFYDSIAIVKTNLIKNESIKLCDFGTGAGFPGIVIKIFFPNINVTLIESNNKKCIFLNEIIKELNLNNIEVINERMEIYTKKNRELFDIVTCRAVSHLRIISELAIPLLKVNGYFLPLKSNIDEEIKESKDILDKLDSKIESIISYELPIENSKRNILIVKKIKETNLKYPREYKKIIKNN